MTHATLTPRTHQLVTRVEGWAHGSPTRAIAVKIGVTVVGPLLVVAGVAMTVLPGPGLVVIALGMALLALEYDWARTVVRTMGRTLSRARQAAFPRGATGARRAGGVLAAGALVAATTGLTAAVTAWVGTLTVV
jgi:uncharacterized protein (TIGR02611 family)